MRASNTQWATGGGKNGREWSDAALCAPSPMVPPASHRPSFTPCPKSHDGRHSSFCIMVQGGMHAGEVSVSILIQQLV